MDYQSLYRTEKQNAEYWRNLFYQVGSILFPESSPAPKEVLDKVKELKSLTTTPENDGTIQQA